jgi:hypothetical protein
MKRLIIYIPAFLIGAGLITSCGSTEVVDTTGNNTDVDSVEAGLMENHDHADDVETEAPTTAVYNEQDYMVYGMNRDFPVTDISTVDDLLAAVNETAETEMVIASTAHEVCQMAGCWIKVGNDNGEMVRVKFKDHFTLPIESSHGKHVVFHGVGIKEVETVEMQKHYLKDAMKEGGEVTQADIDAITEPLETISFIADGIMVANGDVIETEVDVTE